MGKKKIADSIIIRVGGGIREVPREPIEIEESQESAHRQHGFAPAEDAHPFGVDLGANTKTGADKIIN